MLCQYRLGSGVWAVGQNLPIRVHHRNPPQNLYEWCPEIHSKYTNASYAAVLNGGILGVRAIASGPMVGGAGDLQSMPRADETKGEQQWTVQCVDAQPLRKGWASFRKAPRCVRLSPRTRIVTPPPQATPPPPSLTSGSATSSPSSHCPRLAVPARYGLCYAGPVQRTFRKAMKRDFMEVEIGMRHTQVDSAAGDHFGAGGLLFPG